MKQGFVGVLARALVCLFAVCVAGPLCVSGEASAVAYDDFSGAAIDTNRWGVIGAGFSQNGDGYLRFSGSGPVVGMIGSKKSYEEGVFTMSFSDYASNNNAPPARGLGSVMGLGLGNTATGWVRIERGQVRDAPYIEVNWVLPTNADPTKIYVNFVPVLANLTAGSLRIRYDGKQVTFFHILQGTWTQMIITGIDGKPVLGGNGLPQPLVLPLERVPVPIYIEGRPGGTEADQYTLSFKIDDVTVDALPRLKAPTGFHIVPQ